MSFISTIPFSLKPRVALRASVELIKYVAYIVTQSGSRIVHDSIVKRRVFPYDRPGSLRQRRVYGNQA